MISIYTCGSVFAMKKYKIIIKTSEKDRPYDFELSAAEIVANYFRKNVIFLRPGPLKSPDLDVGGEIWELKSPMGDGKNTIHNVFVTSRKQSYNIVIDLRRCKMNEQKAFARIRNAYNKRRRKRCRLLVIDKKKKIFDISEII